MTGPSSIGPLPEGSATADGGVYSAAAALPAPREAGLTDGSGRRIALEPPVWDLMPPAETETVRRFRLT